MTMPDANHTMKIALRATPIQRWRKMAERISAAVGRIIGNSLGLAVRLLETIPQGHERVNGSSRIELVSAVDLRYEIALLVRQILDVHLGIDTVLVAFVKYALI